MNYTITIREDDLNRVQASLFSAVGLEGAAFLLCGESRTDSEVRLLCREVILVSEAHYRDRKSDFLSIDAQGFVPLAKRAKLEGLSVVFVHSHPDGFLEYSEQDNREEPKLQEFLQLRVPDQLHGSLLLTETGIIGRVWTGDSFEPMNRIRVLGRRFRFYDWSMDEEEIPHFFDRQVRAFGPEIQMLFHRLHVGVVGAGGTGSPVIEQLTRLGVGTISVFDGDVFDEPNVNRGYGSSTSDTGQFKVNIASRHVKQIGLGTTIHRFAEHITKEAIARELRNCDVIFGCTDKEAPRGILVQIALRYFIPVFDMGVQIQSKNGLIEFVIGRVTTLLPGEACLFCRGRISAKTIQLESLSAEERAALAEEGYAPELETPAPAVIPFTTTVSAFSISEFLNRLTGFMGSERESSEVLCFFDQTRLATNRVTPQEGCLCTQTHLWGRGDTKRFLDSSWSI